MHSITFPFFFLSRLRFYKQAQTIVSELKTNHVKLPKYNEGKNLHVLRILQRNEKKIRLGSTFWIRIRKTPKVEVGFGQFAILSSVSRFSFPKFPQKEVWRNGRSWIQSLWVLAHLLCQQLMKMPGHQKHTLKC